MKATPLLLALSTLFGTAHAQTPAAKPAPFSDAKSKAIGRKFIKKSKPYDSAAPVRLPALKPSNSTPKNR